jgi:heptosyltransferase-1
MEECEKKDVIISNGDRVLLNRHSALGDVVKAMPFAKALKRAFPWCHLTWFVKSPLDELVKCQPYVDDVLIWEEGPRNRTFFKAIKEVKKRRFDKLVCLQGTDRGALLSLFSGIPVRIGNHRWAGFAYTHRVWDVAAFLGIEPERCEKPWMYIPDETILKTRNYLKNMKRPLLFSIIGGSKKIKRWPEKSWIGLLKEMISAGWSAVLAGYGEEEKKMAAGILNALGNENVMDLVGRLGILETAALASVCDAALGGDTGLLHIANSTGVPSVGLFGPTLPEQVGLAGLDKYFISPCSEAGCQRWDCPKKECLGLIDPDNVSKALLDLVRTRADR